jgi:hypothetical protein
LILADDSFIVREGLREILSAQPGVDVVAVCGDLDRLLEAVRSRNRTSSSPTSARPRRTPMRGFRRRPGYETPTLTWA